MIRLKNGYRVDPAKIILRYADVLLMYAEAKIELNEIDQSVLDAINEFVPVHTGTGS